MFQKASTVVLTSVFALTMGTTVPVRAQSAADTENSTSSSGIEEITVTAQKRVENAQRVPISITALSAKDLQAERITSALDLPNVVPGLSESVIIGTPEYVIRGIGTYSSAISIEQGVPLYVDGVYYPMPGSTISSLDNLSGLEVDKGPQGTLFGRNAIGGVILATTKDPQQTPEIDVRAGYGNYNTTTASLYATGGITDNLSADIDVYTTNQRNGWGTNLWDNKPDDFGSDFGVRTKWMYTGGDTTVTFIADYDINRPIDTEPSLLTGYYGDTYGQPHLGGFFDTYSPSRISIDMQQHGFSLTVNHDFGGITARSISAYRVDMLGKNQWNPGIPPYGPIGAETPPAPGTYTYQGAHYDENTFTQEFDVLSPDDQPITWTAGTFLYLDKAGGPGSGGAYWDWQHTLSNAAFAQATAHLPADTELTVGYRYTVDDRSISGLQYGQRGPNCLTSPCGSPVNSAANNPVPEKTFARSSYKGVLTHHFSDDVMVYTSYTTSFQSGFYNLTGGLSSPPLKPETIKAWEAGIKSQWLDNRLQFDAAAFYYNMTNLVVTQSVNQGGAEVGELLNAASAVYKGYESNIALAVTPELELTANVSYVDPYYTNFKNAPFLSPASGSAYALYAGDATGSQVVNSEKFAAKIGLRYTITTEHGDFELSSDVAHHGSFKYDVQGLTVQPPYTLLNASLTWRKPDGQWDVQLWGKNLTNTLYTANMLNSQNQFWMFPAPPRTFGFIVGYHY